MERRSDPDLNSVLRGTRSSGPRAGTVVDARMTLAVWLRAGRAQRGMSLEDVARITKIQIKILERLEAGKPDGLPADVFVRGFVRSVAKCVGLDEDEALKRYSDCSGATTQAPAAARAMVEAMGDLTPALGQAISRPAPAPAPAPARQTKDLIIPDDFVLPSASQPIVVEAVEAAAAIEPPLEVEIAVEAPAVEASAVTASVVEAPVGEAQVGEAAAPAAPAKKKRGKRATAAGTTAAGTTAGGTTAAAKPRKRKARMATGTPVEPSPVVEAAKSDASPSPAASVVSSTASPVEASIASSITSSTTSAIPSSVASSTAASTASAADASIDIVVETEQGTNVIDASNASDDLFAPKLTEYDPDDLFAPRPFEPEAATDAIHAATAIDATDGLVSSSIDAQGATVDADMVETFGDEPIATATWQPKMPPLAATTSVPWRRPGMVTSTAPVASLVAVIDDADPEGAERLLEERRSSGATQRRSFLPPILLDREDRSARQGGLTLAVIILLIAATLTLSYLMRRPSSSGDGVTQRDVATETSATLA